MNSYENCPSLIDIKAYETGFIVRTGTTSTYYSDFENLAKALYPSVRRELNNGEACAGSC